MDSVPASFGYGDVMGSERFRDGSGTTTRHDDNKAITKNLSVAAVIVHTATTAGFGKGREMLYTDRAIEPRIPARFSSAT